MEKRACPPSVYVPRRLLELLGSLRHSLLACNRRGCLVYPALPPFRAAIRLWSIRTIRPRAAAKICGTYVRPLDLCDNQAQWLVSLSCDESTFRYSPLDVE